jgi:hypothetical protein
MKDVPSSIEEEKNYHRHYCCYYSSASKTTTLNKKSGEEIYNFISLQHHHLNLIQHPTTANPTTKNQKKDFVFNCLNTTTLLLLPSSTVPKLSQLRRGIENNNYYS